VRRAALAVAALAVLAASRPARADEPFDEQRRILDVELHPLLSVPDALGVCVEGFPLQRGLSVVGCGSIQVFLTSAVSLELVYRFPLRTSPSFNLSLGPAVGSHAIADSIHGPWIDFTADGFVSLEGVWWGDRMGFQMQAGLGAMYMAWDKPSGITDRWVPIADLTVGVAFRSGR
jgi:hypothetical protein